MSLFGTVMMFVFILWSFVSLILMNGFSSAINFLRSMNFVIVCVGYVIILVVFYMLKEIMRKWENE